MKFHPIKGYNGYCGPCALATILGITTDEAARRVRDRSRQKIVKAVKPIHLRSVLEDAGVQLIKIPPFVKSIKNLTREEQHYQSGFYLCQTTTHFLVLELRSSKQYPLTEVGWYFVDSHCRMPTPLRETNLTKRIEALYFLVAS